MSASLIWSYYTAPPPRVKLAAMVTNAFGCTYTAELPGCYWWSSAGVSLQDHQSCDELCDVVFRFLILAFWETRKGTLMPCRAPSQTQGIVHWGHGIKQKYGPGISWLYSHGIGSLPDKTRELLSECCVTKLGTSRLKGNGQRCETRLKSRHLYSCGDHQCSRSVSYTGKLWQKGCVRW